MTQIRIVRNDAGNCINFYGTSNPTYWNACLSASIDETFPDRINVRNDIRSAEEGTDVFEFYQIPYTTFLDKDGNGFESPAEAAQYITDNANVIGDTGTYIFSETDTLDAQREDTNTTVLFSNGDSYSVNALRAVDAENGTITIRTVRADKEIYRNIRHYNVTVNDGAVSFNTVAAAVDRLNEVLTGSAITSDSGSVSGGAATETAFASFEVYGSRLTETGSGSTAGYTSTAEAGNFDTSNGILSVESISKPGEFFEFSQDQGDWSNAQGLTFGLFDETAYDRADLEVDEPGNAVKSLLRLRLQNSPFIFKDPASDKGRLNEAGFQNSPETRETFRVGLDASNRAYVAMRLEDGTFQNVGRTETALAADTELKFVAIFPLANEMNGVRNMTVNTLVEAPELTWYFIESPDGSFHYPLFQTEEEANYVDELYGTAASGSGTNMQHLYPDEQPQVNTWYMPGSYGFHSEPSAPVPPEGVAYNEISTGDDAAYAPAALNIADHNWPENHSVNLQIVPAGDDPATVTGLPEGLTYANGFITGTTPYVPSDTDYTITVVRSNAYGSTTETFEITIQDNASLGDLAGFTEFGGNLLQPNRVILTHDALLQYDTQINPGEELTYSYGSGAVPPTIGILSTGAQTLLDGFDPAAGDELGTGDYDYAGALYWGLRYVSFGDDIGSNSGQFNLRGWDNNNTIQGAEGVNHGVEFKLEYGLDGLFRLYRGGVLLLTSVNTFSGAQTLTFAAFDSQQQSDVYVPSNLTITNSSAGTTTPPSGFADPLEAGVMASQTLLGDGNDWAAVSLTQTLAVNHRFIIPQEWIETNVLPYIAGAGANSAQDEQFYFGVPRDGMNWSTQEFDVNWFHAVSRIEGYNSAQGSRVWYNEGSSSTNTTLIGSATNAYYEYGLEWDGTQLHVIRCNANDLNTTPSIADGGTFASVQSMTLQEFAGQPLPLWMGVRNGGQINLTTSGLSNIRTPFGAQTILAGEDSSGSGDFKTSPVNTDYDSHAGGHAPADFTFAAVTSLNAGSTYKFIYHPSMEADDFIEFRLASDGTTVYTTGVTAFGSGDPDFTSAYKGVEFAVPSDAPPLTLYYFNGFSSAYDSGRPVSVSGSTYVTPVTGVTQEGPAANQTGTNLFDESEHGWISVDEQLGAGERLVLDSAFLLDLVSAMPDDSDMRVGLKDTLWTDAYASWFEGGTFLYIARYGVSDVRIRINSNGSSTSTFTTSVSGIAGYEAFIEITSSGNNIRIGMKSSSNSGDNASTTAYADWASAYKLQTGDQGYGLTSVDVMLMGSGNLAGNSAGMDSADVDWTGLSEISVPTPAAALTTSWTKALDFSGSAERTQQVNSNYLYAPLNMGNMNTTVAAPANAADTSNDTFSRPWATAIVFSVDGNSSNQHIWNCGEGAGSTDDNIYLRVDANRNLYFGWGRDGALNECHITYFGGAITANTWHGLYIAHNGTRLAGGHTAADISACFDIHLVDLSTGVVGNNLSTDAGWTDGGFGGRMDRQIVGTFTIGGRGANRNFHGKVASMVSTTLRNNVAMPVNAEISMMVRDPMQWLTDYKVGQVYRRTSVNTDHTSNFTLDDYDPSHATQVWLMGDGVNDAYAQIRNQVFPAEQNRTPMNMTSMVANDIETVNIPGLS